MNKIIAISTLLLFLASCSSQKSQDKGNTSQIKDAIQSTLSPTGTSHYNSCLQGFFTGDNSAYGFPKEFNEPVNPKAIYIRVGFENKHQISYDKGEDIKNAITFLDYLVSQQLLASQQVTFYSNKTHNVGKVFKMYTPLKEIEKYSHTQDKTGQLFICYANYDLDKIEYANEITPGIIRVRYILKLIDLAPWAKNAPFDPRETALLHLKELTQVGELTLHKTDNGYTTD